jgi:hypothetical protein
MNREVRQFVNSHSLKLYVTLAYLIEETMIIEMKDMVNYVIVTFASLLFAGHR